MHIKTFVFNPFQLNTYVLYDETKSCVIIDPGCYDPEEEAELEDFITNEGLTPQYCLLTHCHVDHILGLNFVEKRYGITTYAHSDGLQFVPKAHLYMNAFGFDSREVGMPKGKLEEGTPVIFGNSQLIVLHTPGHVDGSVCFVSSPDRFVISGDVLFYESIGRTDLPTGNLNLLMQSIREKLFALPDDFTVYPGHGHETTIYHEKHNNPFME